MVCWPHLAGRNLMTLRDLIDVFRSLSMDTKSPYFVSDQLAISFANEAQIEACRRSDAIIDSSSSFCQVSILSGRPAVKLHPSIMELRRARMQSGAYMLEPVTTTELDTLSVQWESETGVPSHYVTDYSSGHIFLYPSPATADTLMLTVRRLPVSSMIDDADVPEVREETHMALVHWMLYRAFSIPDSDFYSPTRAGMELAEFEREFGRKSSSRNELWSRVSHPSLDVSPIA